MTCFFLVYVKKISSFIIKDNFILDYLLLKSIPVGIHCSRNISKGHEKRWHKAFSGSHLGID